MKYAAIVLLLFVVGMTTAAQKYNILPQLTHSHVIEDFKSIKFSDRQIGEYDITGIHANKITATKATLTRCGNKMQLGKMELDSVTVLVAGKAENRITNKVGTFFYRVVLKDVIQVLKYPKRTTISCKVTFTSNIESIWVGGKKKMSKKLGSGKGQTGVVCTMLKKLEHIVWKHTKSTKG